MTFSNAQIEPEQLPRVEDLAFKSLEKKYLRVSLIETALSWAFVFIMIALSLTIARWWIIDWVVGLGFGAWLVFAIFRLIMSYLGFSKKQYALREKDISYKYGIIRQNLISIPFNRIQHCEVDEGFVERAFGLATLKVFTAGGSGADLAIPGLTPEIAGKLKQFLLQQTEMETNE